MMSLCMEMFGLLQHNFTLPFVSLLSVSLSLVFLCVGASVCLESGLFVLGKINRESLRGPEIIM